ncbi:MFS transporter [Arcicella rigui]|uniref:MFS transporter n=1 Tax=Arcicella rigui TaxID=797020 RepID=A0ABU5QFN2_9BACT|nr:MFS transporter [Arcicella rigui]MEA5141689.1 MFS transporter [Arcicella rigui]
MNNQWKIYLLTIVCFFTGTSEFVIVGVLDEISKSANITISQAGQLIAVFAITSAIGTPISIFYLRALNQQKIIMLALLLIIIGSVLLSIAPNYSLMILSRIIMALGVGLFNVQCFLVATKLVSPEKRASAIGTVTIGFNAALILGLPMGRIITAMFGWKAIFWILALFCFASMALVYKFIPAFEVEKPTPFKKQLSAIKNTKIVLSMGISLFWILGYATYYTFITPYLRQVSLLSEQLLSPTLLAFGIATLIGNRLGGYLGDKFGIPQVILICMLLNTASILTLSMLKGTPLLIIPALMTWALAAWAPGPLLRYNVISLSSEEPGVILSLYNSLIQVGVAAGAGLGGIVINHLPIISLSYTAAMLVFISSVITFFFIKSKKYGIGQ